MANAARHTVARSSPRERFGNLDVDTGNIRPLCHRVVDTVNMRTDRPYHHGRLRESLVDAGYELARVSGPEAVVLRAVTRAAGVSHNAAYRHFEDHQQLLNAVADRCMGELADLMRRGAARVRERDPRRRAAAEL